MKHRRHPLLIPEVLHRNHNASSTHHSTFDEEMDGTDSAGERGTHGDGIIAGLLKPLLNRLGLGDAPIMTMEFKGSPD